VHCGFRPRYIFLKRTDSTADWYTYDAARNTYNGLDLELDLNLSIAETGAGGITVDFVSNGFKIRRTGPAVNASGGTYVAYLWADDTASTGLIRCGSYTGNGSATGPVIDLGWGPQWLMVKDATSTGSWRVLDNMRGMPVGSGAAALFPDLSNAEFTTGTVAFSPTATGFQVAGTAAQINTSGNTYIYMAIRRGPMKTPTLGTSVFMPVATNATNNPQTGFPLDLWWLKARNGVELHVIMDRMRQTGKYLSSDSTAAEANNPANYYRIDNMTGGFSNGGTFSEYIHWCLRRAPGFFDVVCYTGTGVLGGTVAHNLGVAPEMIIVKRRSAANDWGVYHSALGNTKLIYLNYNLAPYTSTNWWNNTTPTASVFTVGDQNENNASGSTYVSYLFASCPGVSKVGGYTGNGSSQTINCAFTTGARYVLIKRTDSTGDWYVWDSARGIVAGNDPYLALNSTAVEVTTNDSVDTDNTGFIVNQVAASNINVNAATYIFLAIA
jgi:hypothetical protein